MQIEVGDRVRFKAELPDQQEPALQHQVGWAEHDNGPGWGEPITRTWSEHFGGESGVVVAIDRFNGVAMVRGRHREGVDFTIEAPLDSVEVSEQGVPRP